MKKIVLLTALLCLLIAFQSVFAYTEPQPYTNLIYTGDQQYLVSEGKGDTENEVFYFWNEYRTPASWDTDRPAEQLPGTYTVRFVLAKPSDIKNIKKDDKIVKTVEVTIKEYMPPQAIEGLVYNGSKQTLVIPGTALKDDVYYYRNPYWPSEAPDKWTTTPTEATDPGSYDVEY